MRAIYNAVTLRMTKEEADSLYLGKEEKAISASSADSVNWSDIQDIPQFGLLAIKNNVTIDQIVGLEDRLSKEDEDYGSIS